MTSPTVPGPGKLIAQLRERLDIFLGLPKLATSSTKERTDALFGDWKSSAWNTCAGPYASPTRPIQIAVQEVIRRIQKHQWGAYMVGGTLRDLMLAPKRTGVLGIFPRDIDVVVLGATLEDLTFCFSDLIQRHTRYGGLHLVKTFPGVCEMHFDVWPLQETWALKEYDQPADIAIFPRFPFLNMDAIAIALLPDVRPRHVYDQDEAGNHIFFQGLAQRLIDINFKPNPYPDICAVRGLIIAAKLGFDIGRELATFILERASQDSLTNFVEAQMAHYGLIRSERQELQFWIDSIGSQLESGATRVRIAVPQNRQLGLWTDYPPMPIAAETSRPNSL